MQALLGLLKVLKVANIESVVDVSQNGEETVQLIEQAIREGEPDRYSLIITDCSMPVMDGYESSRRIREALRYYQSQQET